MNYYLSLAALIPAAILFVRIYQLDHIEKEPRRLLGKLVLFGALAAVPAALAQLLLTRAAGAALGRSTVWYLLLDNFVTQEQLAEALKPTTGSVELRLDQEMINSPVLQFVQYLVLREPAWMKKLEAGGLQLDALIDSFMAWRLEEGFNELSTLDAQRMFRENFFAERKSIRDNGRVVKKWILKAPQQSVQELLDQLKGDENAPTESLVDD